ncbi:MAG: TIGR02147 family protein [Bacteriovoracia bacterium]
MKKNSVQEKSARGPVIYQYQDYRAFLRDYYRHMKLLRPEFSFRFLAKRGGFKSSAMYKLVMEGKRNLSPRGATKIARALNLGRRESDFFKNLVNFNQSKTPLQREHFAGELLESEKYKQTHPLNEAHFNYFSRWFSIPIREMVGAQGFRDDPNFIAKQLIPAIATHDAKKALSELQALGILARNPDTGRLKHNTYSILTQDEVTSSYAAQFHREMIRLAGEAIDRIPKPDRDISAATFLLSEEAARQFKETIRAMRDKLMDIVAHDDRKSPRVYQVNFQFFPLSHVFPEGEE